MYLFITKDILEELRYFKHNNTYFIELLKYRYNKIALILHNL